MPAIFASGTVRGPAALVAGLITIAALYIKGRLSPFEDRIALSIVIGPLDSLVVGGTNPPDITGVKQYHRKKMDINVTTASLAAHNE